MRHCGILRARKMVARQKIIARERRLAMKILARIFGIVIASTAITAHASSYYSVNGYQTSAYAQYTTLTSTPAQPGFTGLFALDTASPAVSGRFSFAPYSMSVSVVEVLGADIVYTNAAYTIAGGTTAYDPATHTWTLTGGNLNYSGAPISCTGDSLICDNHGSITALRLDSLVLTLDESSLSISGTLLATQMTNGLEPHFTWSMQGELSPVPLPATAWLFGSALLGLGAGARRRHVTQKY
jgi:hypothetical protein